MRFSYIPRKLVSINVMEFASSLVDAINVMKFARSLRTPNLTGHRLPPLEERDILGRTDLTLFPERSATCPAKSTASVRPLFFQMSSAGADASTSVGFKTYYNADASALICSLICTHLARVERLKFKLDTFSELKTHLRLLSSPLPATTVNPRNVSQAHPARFCLRWSGSD